MSIVNPISRRNVLIGGASAFALSACEVSPSISSKSLDPLELYKALPDERFSVPAIDPAMIHPGYYRTEVRDPTGAAPGTIYVDTKNYYLYLVGPDKRAMRYGVGLGKAGFGWSGEAIIARKAKWPKWTPPAVMIKRDPSLERYSWENGGMRPGLRNPLGARALYIYQNGVDTLYRLHSTSEVFSIGRAVSSGCVRLVHQDIIDLYNRVPNGSPIIVA